MTRKHLFALSLGFGALILMTHQGQAQTQSQGSCGPRAAVLDQLINRYGETRQAVGLNANNTIMEVFASDTGSWTITITLPSGTTCLAAAGEGYTDVSDEVPTPAGDPV